MNMQTLLDYVEKNAAEIPQQTWLRDRNGDQYTEWNWSDANSEINAVAAWLEQRYGSSKTNIVLLSRNRSHWMLADLAIIGSGNVTVPMFTTLPAPTAQYIFDFTDTRLLILGETDNWAAVQSVLPDGIEIITLPGVQIDSPHTTWEDIVSECSGQQPKFKGEPDDLVSIVFTSGNIRGSCPICHFPISPSDRSSR